MSVFDSESFDGHEGVHFFCDPATGLEAIIAIHSTLRGPGAGGTRFWTYESSALACEDALRLSKAMSYKNAMADIPFGGAKAVVMRPSGVFDREALFRVYGQAVDSLGGRYCTAEDVGVSPEDMLVVSTQTKHVAGLTTGEAASGDPSPITADGVFRGLRSAIAHKYSVNDFKGMRVAVQGLGSVGYNLAARLHAAGAKLLVTDINEAVLSKAEAELNATIVGIDEIHTQDVDIFAPCALGGAINPDTIDGIKAGIVGGAANNQLRSPDMGRALKDRNILYCPDYVINGGGIINVASELSGQFDPDWVDGKLDTLAVTLSDIFRKADSLNAPTNVVADDMARERIYGKDRASAA